MRFSAPTLLLLLLVPSCLGGGRPVYFTHFASPVRPDRYLRNLYDLEKIDLLRHPAMRGGCALDMQLRFTPQYKRGVLHFDLAIVQFSRLQVRIWNPNPPEKKLQVRASLGAATGGSRQMKSQVLIPGWNIYERTVGGSVVECFETIQVVFEPVGGVVQSDQPLHLLAANLRRAFSGIVAGNVKEEGIRRIEEHGPFELRGDARIMALMDRLLESFVLQQRMRLAGHAYRPCYRLVA